ncbi:molybdate metabolism regulator MolR [Escherichia coli TA280]|nr:molybdate metabolism regulator MolR [Escherichia coli TA280]
MRHFIFQDEKSHKFWAVEQQGNELHICWGKVGTKGQNQVKSFADAAAAEKAGLKLIAEKVKKGYVEELSSPSQPAIKIETIEVDTTGVAETTVVFDQSMVAEPAETPCPWLTDDSTIHLSEKKSQEALPSRRFPGDAVSEPQDSLLMNLGQDIHNLSGKITTYDFSACSANWQQNINEALANGPLSPAALAVQVVLVSRKFWDECPELMDEIVYVYGLEFAVDMFIAMQYISFDCTYHRISIHITFQPLLNHAHCVTPFDVRLRKHLALAEETLWQRCVDKFITALPDIPPVQQPMVALMLPERPEIAEEIARRLLEQKNIQTVEWLKLVVQESSLLKALESYCAYDLFNDYYHGCIWNVTVLQEQGIAGIARFAPYAYADLCGSILAEINHPQALMLLIRVSGKTKRCHERMTKACAAFPHTALAALAELLAQKEENSWRIMLMTMLISQPALAEQVTPWLSTPAVAVLKACLQQLTQPSNHACADLLPAVLVSPPWLSKKKKSVIPVLDLTPLSLESCCTLTETAEKEIHARHRWHAHQIDIGQKEDIQNYLARLGFNRWNNGQYMKAPDAAIDLWQRGHYSALISEFKTFWHSYQREWQLYMLAALPIEKTAQAWNVLSKEPHVGVEFVMTHLQLTGLQGFIHSFSRYPQEALPVAQYFAAIELAPLIARAFNKLKTLRQDARTWLLKYPEHAITGLLPSALGKSGEAQDNARAALRMLTENGHQPLLQEIARRYNQPEVTDAVNALLALDPLDNHPTKIPTLPAFYQPSLWNRPVLKASAQSLPDSALQHLGEMLRFHQEEALYPGLLQVKDACTADSLAEFAWDLFTAWQTAGAPSKESWAFTALGVLGNDDTARKLTPLIRAWPGESQHKRATVGLDILAAISSDIALMQLNGIAQKLKFKALQERAKEKIADIAESRELTVAELEDRLAPALGLDDNGSLLLDFGPRQFTVSFDETLKPFVRDVSGSRLKDLPKPNKSDDESQANDAVNRYKLLKKDARTVAAQQVARLESAMCLRRRWSPENFQLFLVEHPLVRHLTRRLIWGVYSAENQLQACFRVAEDNSYSTADDDLFTLQEGDISIGIPHVLEISPTDAVAFGQLFADYELLPPFRQLERNSYALTEAERNASELTRWAGRKCPSGRVMGLANKGWIKGEPQDGGWIGWMIKPLGRWSLIMEIDEGFAVGMSPADLSAEQVLSKLWLWEAKAESYGWGSNSTQEAQFSVLDDITASELINDIEALFE